jgi:hypothetical protein
MSQKFKYTVQFEYINNKSITNDLQIDYTWF